MYSTLLDIALYVQASEPVTVLPDTETYTARIFEPYSKIYSLGWTLVDTDNAFSDTFIVRRKQKFTNLEDNYIHTRLNEFSGRYPLNYPNFGLYSISTDTAIAKRNVYNIICFGIFNVVERVVETIVSDIEKLEKIVSEIPPDFSDTKPMLISIRSTIAGKCCDIKYLKVGGV